jgi:hypothetical protein
MIYRVRDPKNLRPDNVLGFYDIAGEDLLNSNHMHDFNQFLFRAHGLIMLLDPTLDPSSNGHAQNYDMATRFVRESQNHRKGDISVPLAVVLAKADTVPELQQVLQGAPLVSNGQFSNSRCDAISSEVRGYIKLWHQSRILDLLEHNFTHISYFAVSAIGCQPNADLSIPAVRPLRVLDPFLWLLSKNGFIPSV